MYVESDTQPDALPPPPWPTPATRKTPWLLRDLESVPLAIVHDHDARLELEDGRVLFLCCATPAEVGTTRFRARGRTYVWKGSWR